MRRTKTERARQRSAPSYFVEGNSGTGRRDPGPDGTCSIAVIGGGAAGLAAAIAAARELRAENVSSAGERSDAYTVVVLEALSSPGRKIRVTGNGRCNLTNIWQSRDCYRSVDGMLTERLYEDGWDREICDFMESIGVLTHERMRGYIYPRTDQAAVVADAMIKEAGRLGVRIWCDARVEEIAGSPDGRRYVLREHGTGRNGAGRQNTLLCRRVVLSCGGLAAPEFGCRGDGYRIAKALGHEIVRPVPSLCALVGDDPDLKICAGVRTTARVVLMSGSRVLSKAQGELQMTAQGISGIPVFQISRYAATELSASDQALSPKYAPSPGGGGNAGPLQVVIDFLPELSQAQWERECSRRIHMADASDTLGDFLRGLVPDKIAAWILASAGFVREKKIGNLARDPASRDRILGDILKDLRCRKMRITGTDGFDRAQVTAGGIALSEVTEQMESRLAGGLYFAGEVLDVDGICGGYNLTWAIHSGLLAGRAAAASLAGNQS